MKSEKGEPAFQDVDSILSEKVIRRTKQNIDSSEKDFTREDIPRKKTSRFHRVSTVLLWVFLVLLILKGAEQIIGHKRKQVIFK
ncbi:MAG: hypothetical protein GX089_03475 [Fibrobacter sp.]|jgi:hypothetical protein|nr:hypothetical protein [Fibrobacter sp.]